MRKSNLTKTGVAILALSIAGVASAQTNSPSGFSGRLGAHFPRVGDTNLAAGLDYKFPAVPVDPARGGYLSYLGASVDYYGRSNAFNVPVAVTYNVRVNQAVFSAGVGLDVYRAGGRTSTGLGGQLAATYEFGQATETRVNPIFVQAKYFFANQSNLSGLGLYVGVRF